MPSSFLDLHHIISQPYVIFKKRAYAYCCTHLSTLLASPSHFPTFHFRITLFRTSSIRIAVQIMTTVRARAQVIPSVFNRHPDRIGYLPDLHAYLSKEPLNAGKSRPDPVSNEEPPRKRQRLSRPSLSSAEEEVRSTVVLASIEVHLVSSSTIESLGE